MIKYTLISYFIVISLVTIFAPTVVNAQDLGQGYSCSGGKIYKKSKEVTLKKAKSAIQNKINNLGNSKKDKAKKNTLRDVKTAMDNCSKGSTDLTGIVDDLSSGPIDSGSFDGTYVLNGTSYTGRFRVDHRGFKIVYGFSMAANPFFLSSEKEFFFSFDPLTIPLPASVGASVDSSVYESLQNVTALGNVTTTLKKVKGKDRDEFQISISTDSIPSANRINPNAARFEIVILSEIVVTKKYNFSGTVTVYNDAGASVASGTISLIKDN